MKKVFISGVLSAVVLGFIGCGEPDTVEGCEDRYDKQMKELKIDEEAARIEQDGDAYKKVAKQKEKSTEEMILCAKKAACKDASDKEACMKAKPKYGLPW
ncbi:MAG: hypothetical protein LBT96_01925 [Campylobacteraceae bacterium]|jgi:hypothetical protein|nr:hypothetical protein [Campylobacteraceae bacterium]